MAKEIMCIVKFCIDSDKELPEILACYCTPADKTGSTSTRYIIATDSTSNRNVEDLKDDVLHEIKKLNPYWIEGICDIELLNFQDWSDDE